MFDLPLPLVNLTVNLLVGLLLALIVGWYYARFGRSLTNRAQLAALLPVLTMTTALVIAIIKSSLALSLGLVGALSIVRFRTAVKEPEELLYLFLAIAIGLGVGADQRLPVVVGVFLVLGYLAARALLAPQVLPDNLYLDLSLREAGETSLVERVEAALREHVSALELRRLDSRDGHLYLTYLIHYTEHGTPGRLVDDLKSGLPVDELSFIRQDQVLG